MRQWLARLFSRWAERLSPVAVPEALVPPDDPVFSYPEEPQGYKDAHHRPPRFSVARWVEGKYYLAYEGASGGDARRVYEGIIERRESGKMEFWQNVGAGKVVVRGSYERVF